jgi:hypothetical protein
MKNRIDYIVRDEETGYIFVVDILGNTYLASNVETVAASGINSESLVYRKFYVQGYNLSNFPNSTSYHDLPDTTYIVASAEVLHITSIVAAQSKPGLSSLAFYRDNSREQEIPIVEDVYVVFQQPIRYYAGEEFKVGFKPKDKRTRIQVFVDGYTTLE